MDSLVKVDHAEDIGLHDGPELDLGRDAPEMRDGVHALAHAPDFVAVGQVAADHFPAGSGRPDVGHVGQAHDVGEFMQTLAQAPAKLAGGAGEHDTFEWFAHDDGCKDGG